MTAAVTEIAVRMGEIAVSSKAGDVLVSIGLGSCIGLALVDQRRGIAGPAHVTLPEAGATALVGGAQMFSLGTSGALDIGARNDAAVRAAPARERVPLAASATGGSNGRTIPVHRGGAVLSKEAGGAEIELMRGVRP